MSCIESGSREFLTPALGDVPRPEPSQIQTLSPHPSAHPALILITRKIGYVVGLRPFDDHSMLSSLQRRYIYQFQPTK